MVLNALSMELRKRKYTIPIVDAINELDNRNAKDRMHRANKSFKILIATVLSTRTRDNATAIAVKRLFSRIRSPQELVGLKQNQIETLIKKVGFYRVKARNIKEISKILIQKYKGKVPKTMNKLLELPGVGRKVANLVLAVAFDIPAICVDTHVHRIMNRFGYLQTKTPLETEMALRKKLPKKYWLVVNNLLVTLGQNICRPIGPRCEECPVSMWCEKKISKRKNV